MRVRRSEKYGVSWLDFKSSKVLGMQVCTKTIVCCGLKINYREFKKLRGSAVRHMFIYSTAAVL